MTNSGTRESLGG